MSNQRFNSPAWLMGVVAALFVGGSLGWATYVSREVASASDRLARIETKLDILMEHMSKNVRQ